MILKIQGRPYNEHEIYALFGSCQEDVYTVDLLDYFRLKRIPAILTTVQTQMDPVYSSLDYYKRKFEYSAKRVNDLFQTILRVSPSSIEKRSVEVEEIIDFLMEGNGYIIALIDSHKFYTVPNSDGIAESAAHSVS